MYNKNVTFNPLVVILKDDSVLHSKKGPLTGRITDKLTVNGKNCYDISSPEGPEYVQVEESDITGKIFYQNCLTTSTANPSGYVRDQKNLSLINFFDFMKIVKYVRPTRKF